jgi:type IV pilus assembly protein PilX
MRLPNTRSRQRGAALIVGLILLLVLTVLGVSTMRTAALELVMAGNVQFRENAFQLASSGLDTVLQQARDNTVPLNAAVGWQQDLGTTRVEALRGEFDTSISYLGESSPYSGYSASEFRLQHFQVDAEGRTDQRGARSIQSQGIYLVTKRDNQ